MHCRLVLLILTLGSVAHAQELTVSAAVSLKESLTEVAQSFEQETGWKIRLNFGATGQLLAQIREGAPVNIFITAADEQMDQAEALKLVNPATRRIITRNSLVLIVPASSKLDIRNFNDLADAKVKRIAIGEPRTVPAGQYAHQVFEHLNLTELNSSREINSSRPYLNPRLVYGASVRQVLDYVARGEVDAGVVYATDAQADAKVRVVARAEPSWHQPIRYSAAAVMRTSNPREARAFVEYLVQPAAQERFAAHGFASSVAAKPQAAEGGELWPATLLSLRVTVVATLLVALIGIPLAFAMARHPFRGQSLAEAIFIVPLVLPPTVVGYFILVTLGARGPIGSLLQRTLGYSVLFNWHGAVIASAVVALPLLYLPAKAAFAVVSRDLEDTARLAGASPARMFWHVSLPLARRGIASGLMLAFARALGEFGATMMVLGDLPGRRTLPISIYDDYVSGQLMRAAPGVAALTGVSLLVILLYNRSPLGRRD